LRSINAMKKRILDPDTEATPGPRGEGLDVSVLATMLVTSEAPDHPIESAFDGRGGPGGTRWVAASPGPQTVVLEFDSPQDLAGVDLEVEEWDVARRQAVALSASTDGGASWRELLRQEYVFSPPGTTFERERWSIAVLGLTHLRLRIVPDVAGTPCRASLTALVLRGSDGTG